MRQSKKEPIRKFHCFDIYIYIYIYIYITNSNLSHHEVTSYVVRSVKSSLVLQVLRMPSHKAPYRPAVVGSFPTVVSGAS